MGECGNLDIGFVIESGVKSRTSEGLGSWVVVPLDLLGCAVVASTSTRRDRPTYNFCSSSGWSFLPFRMMNSGRVYTLLQGLGSRGAEVFPVSHPPVGLHFGTPRTILSLVGNKYLIRSTTNVQKRRQLKGVVRIKTASKVKHSSRIRAPQLSRQ